MSLGGGEIALGWWFEECLVPYLTDTDKLREIKSISIVTGYGKTRTRGRRHGDDGMRKRVKAMLMFMDIRELDQPNLGRIHIDMDALIDTINRNGGRIIFDLDKYLAWKEAETTINVVPDAEQKIRPRYRPKNSGSSGPPFERIETDYTSPEYLLANMKSNNDAPGNEFAADGFNMPPPDSVPGFRGGPEQDEFNYPNGGDGGRDGWRHRDDFQTGPRGRGDRAFGNRGGRGGRGFSSGRDPEGFGGRGGGRGDFGGRGFNHNRGGFGGGRGGGRGGYNDDRFGGREDRYGSDRGSNNGNYDDNRSFPGPSNDDYYGDHRRAPPAEGDGYDNQHGNGRSRPPYGANPAPNVNAHYGNPNDNDGPRHRGSQGEDFYGRGANDDGNNRPHGGDGYGPNRKRDFNDYDRGRPQTQTRGYDLEPDRQKRRQG